MSNYFVNFPKVQYYFGDEENSVLFDNISVYIDLIDQLSSNPEFYQKYFIKENERPDALSYKLYGTTNYHWTFLFANTKLRESGWPISNRAIVELAKKYYPHKTITSQSELFNKFDVGKTISGSISGATGIVVDKRIDLGQIIVSTENTFFEGESVTQTDDPTKSIIIYSFTQQYNSNHHYENADGDYIDIDPYNISSSTSGLIPITFTERLRNKNDDLRQINVIRPDAVKQVDAEFKKYLKRS